jgi:glyoxylase-like metal-dependent hydrolase (beta-lactamase superfamily II)
MQLYPGLFVISCPFGQGRTVNISLFSGRRRLLVDSGVAATPESCIIPALRGQGRSPADIDLLVCLHAHADHIGGNAALLAASGSKLRIGAHALDVPAIAEHQVLATQAYGLTDNERVVALLERRGADALVHEVYQGGEVIDLGGLALEVIHAPGHTVGNLSLYDGAHRTLVHGESVMGTLLAGDDGLRSTWQLGVEPLVYRQTLEKLRALPFELFVPSHEPPMDRRCGLERIDAALAQCGEFEAHVRAVLDRGLRGDDEGARAEIAHAVAAEGRYQNSAAFERQVASLVRAWGHAGH